MPLGHSRPRGSRDPVGRRAGPARRRSLRQAPPAGSRARRGRTGRSPAGSAARDRGDRGGQRRRPGRRRRRADRHTRRGEPSERGVRRRHRRANGVAYADPLDQGKCSARRRPTDRCRQRRSRTALRASDGPGGEYLRVGCLGQLALVEVHRGQLRKATDFARRAHATAEACGLAIQDRPPALDVALAWVHAEEYDLAPARVHCERAAATSGIRNDPVSAGSLALTLGPPAPCPRRFRRRRRRCGARTGDPG